MTNIRELESDVTPLLVVRIRWNSWSVLVLYVTALISIESVVGIGLTVAVTLVSFQVVAELLQSCRRL